MLVSTIGFTRRDAREFFELLQASGAKRILDVRLNSTSQLAGFSKRNDLAYFANVIASIDYVPVPALAPTKEILRGYRAGELTWEEYEVRYIDLISERKVEQVLARELIDGGCLLCSELGPERCHRRLAVEYLQGFWPDLVAVHL